MNEKIKAIWLQIIVALKHKGWVPDANWEITSVSEQHIPLKKVITVSGEIESDSWKDEVDTHVRVKLISRDEITYFVNININATVQYKNLNTLDIDDDMSIDVAITEKDIKNSSVINRAADRVDSLVEEHISHLYTSYIDSNKTKIQLYDLGSLDEEDEYEV